MATFNERFQSTGVDNAWHAISASAVMPPALRSAFTALDAGTKALATALRVSVASLRLAKGVAAAANLNPAEIALREALSEIDTFLAQLTQNGGPTIHILFVPVVRKKALPNAEVLTRAFRESAVEFLRGDPNKDAAALVTDAMSQSAGMGGFIRSVMTSLADGGDSQRPMFPASYATAGVCLVAGGETYADLVVPARLLTSLFDARRARLPLLNHVESVPQNVRVTPIPGSNTSVSAVVRWDPVPPINQVPVGRADVIHNEEIVIVCVEGPLAAGESYDWETLFAGVTLPANRATLPSNKAGTARVIARLRNHGMTQSYTDTRVLDGALERRYVVYLRERQRDPDTNADRYFVSPPSGAVWMPRTSSTSTRATRGTPPDWYAVPSVVQALPPLADALAGVRTQLSRAGTYTTVNTGAGQLVDRTISTLEHELTTKAAEIDRVATVTSNLNALASSAAAVSVGLNTILLTSPRGGMPGWVSKLAASLTDPNDPGRPQYTSSAPMTGVILVAGAPRLPQLASIIALFKLLFGSKTKHPLADLVRQLDTPSPASAANAGTASRTPATRQPTKFNAAMQPVETPDC
jgi:hypothetical protein